MIFDTVLYLLRGVDMNDIEIKFREYCDKVAKNKLPRWNELPEIELYMDQTVAIISKYLSPYFGNEEKNITPSMINNYVKLQIAPPPVKKKYAREHIACLIMISILKQILSMNELSHLISKQNENLGVQSAYDSFCEQIEFASKTVCETYLSTFAKMEFSKSTNDISLLFAAIAFGGKILSERLLQLNMPKEEPSEKEKKKKKSKEEKESKE